MKESLRLDDKQARPEVRAMPALLTALLARRKVRRIESGAHELGTRKLSHLLAVVNADRVVSRFIEAGKLHPSVRRARVCEHLVVADNCLTAVIRDNHPGCGIARERVFEAVERTLLDELAVLLHELDLLADLIEFLCGELAEVELIAERAEVGHVAAQFEARIAEDLVVRRNRDG